MLFRQRSVSLDDYHALTQQGTSPLLARLLAARGVKPQELSYKLSALLPFDSMKNIKALALRLAKARLLQEKIVVVADYDADGATACVVALKGLRALGAQVDFVVPNRFKYGYGLTPEIVELAGELRPALLLTVDNGIASGAGVKAAQRLGIETLITDHHLPGETLPDALIVNPNQAGCPFASKHLAGVGVVFYVLIALRALLREQGLFQSPELEPNLSELLDLVALGTVADVVRLDYNNRILVNHGIERIRAGLACPGMTALFKVAGRLMQKASVFDLGFTLGPRINAAGRLDDISIGIKCLLAEDLGLALQYAHILDSLNRERRQIEASMRVDALIALAECKPEERYTLTLYHPNWHQGVVGIVAARLKERFYRPTIVFAASETGELRGSGRSIAGFHLRDALDLVHKRHDGLISKFGGHAMAAGLSLVPEHFSAFARAFEEVARELLSEQQLNRAIETDGALQLTEFSLTTVESLHAEVWGQGFPAPCFNNQFAVLKQCIVGNKHLKLQLSYDDLPLDAMLFNHTDPLPDTIDAVYQLVANEWQGRKTVQLYIEHWVPGNRRQVTGHRGQKNITRFSVIPASDPCPLIPDP